MPATTRSNQVAANAAEDVDANADNVEEIEEIYADENDLKEWSTDQISKLEITR